MPFIFVKVGPTSEKPLIFNTECTSLFLYDQIKEVVFSKTEAFARKKDAEIRQELNLLESLISAHKRAEPQADNGRGKDKDDDGEESLDGNKNLDAIHTADMDNWYLEQERLEALKALRENQSAQLLSGLTGFRELNSAEALIELHDKDKDAVPFPLKTDPLIPASDILGHRTVFTLFRANMPVQSDGDSEELVTVSLSFELDPEPGPDFGKEGKKSPTSKKDKHGHH
mmetsp:Transcript_7567/g.8959  ORF Transcript_7567/g.8959 Transcript_7567/m.8959 type:complete len:228 (+) Transcript_7567:190-873(+)|eukprot:CAMPEP_0114334474 /NCGR_PEP_ID=MMETSP0101-20121206/4396_1 /TAXON_ID=38822 ORGANISM="Pteridomonas danica, Strain PT" /NCGR_SAMPLE_ID=MMETSP0101 /ASSEMBLY_ACC=CAM_ASM_000211 /LENGTH=227 /DNA_ID=CAMNT_0001465739 /DNA_START=212 /DNA_END=895 /DNA_ORIENTATION=+